MSRYYNDFNDTDDSNYLEHYGRKGMKWKKHIFGLETPTAPINPFENKDADKKVAKDAYNGLKRTQYEQSKAAKAFEKAKADKNAGTDSHRGHNRTRYEKARLEAKEARKKANKNVQNDHIKGYARTKQEKAKLGKKLAEQAIAQQSHRGHKRTLDAKATADKKLKNNLQSDHIKGYAKTKYESKKAVKEAANKNVGTDSHRGHKQTQYEQNKAGKKLKNNLQSDHINGYSKTQYENKKIAKNRSDRTIAKDAYDGLKRSKYEKSKADRNSDLDISRGKSRTAYENQKSDKIVKKFKKRLDHLNSDNPDYKSRKELKSGTTSNGTPYTKYIDGKGRETLEFANEGYGDKESSDHERNRKPSRFLKAQKNINNDVRRGVDRDNYENARKVSNEKKMNSFANSVISQNPGISDGDLISKKINSKGQIVLTFNKNGKHVSYTTAK